MPALDMSDALLEPQLQDCFTVLRRSEAINEFGENVITVQRIRDVEGVVSPGNSHLERGPDMQNMPQVIEIDTTFRLQGPSPGRQADVVLWSGDNFLVTSINDSARYGFGWVHAVCSSIDNLDLPSEDPES